MKWVCLDVCGCYLCARPMCVRVCVCVWHQPSSVGGTEGRTWELADHPPRRALTPWGPSLTFGRWFAGSDGQFTWRCLSTRLFHSIRAQPGRSELQKGAYVDILVVSFLHEHAAGRSPRGRSGPLTRGVAAWRLRSRSQREDRPVASPGHVCKRERKP